MDLSRKTAFDVLFEIEKENAYSNITLNHFIKINEPDNPAFVRELVYGVLENKIYLDYCLDKHVNSGIKKVKKKEKTLLRMGLYQLLFMDSVPDYAAVSETVKAAKKICRGREGFINGVLRNCMRNRDGLTSELPQNRREYLSVKYSFPMWLIDMWIDQYGDEECQKLLEASNQRPQLSIRVNLGKISRDLLAEKLEAKGFEVEKGTFSQRTLFVKGTALLDTDEYVRGLFSVQDEASTVAADKVGASAGETVIDVCAAPGGKTCAMAELMENKGKIIACDIYDHKLKLIENQAERLNIDIIDTMLLDGIAGSDKLKESADRVLADVPCSGLGVIRRKPEIKYKDQENFDELIEIQKKILNRSGEYVKPGGILLYSTCTVNKNENEKQIIDFIESNKNFEILEQRQFLPTEDIDGFYFCKMRKRGE